MHQPSQLKGQVLIDEFEIVFTHENATAYN